MPTLSPLLRIYITRELTYPANGDEKYCAWVQGQHDIHCLDNVCNYMFRKFYYRDEVDNPIIGSTLPTLLAWSLAVSAMQAQHRCISSRMGGRQDTAVVDFNVSCRCLDYQNDYLDWEPSSQRSHLDF